VVFHQGGWADAAGDKHRELARAERNGRLQGRHDAEKPKPRHSHVSPNVLLWNALLATQHELARGIPHLTALALPQNFPERGMLLFAAFAVTLGTLLVQGLVAPAGACA
jgi:hypothetical protein